MKHLFTFVAALCITLAASAQSFVRNPNASLVKTGGTYILGDQFLTEKQVGQLYEAQCPEAFAKYKSAKACIIAGSTVVALGGVELVAVGACRKIISHKKQPLAYSVGSIVTGTGLIVMLCAPLKYNKAVDVFNSRNQRTMTLVPSVGADGVGLALQW